MRMLNYTFCILCVIRAFCGMDTCEMETMWAERTHGHGLSCWLNMETSNDEQNEVKITNKHRITTETRSERIARCF